MSGKTSSAAPALRSTASGCGAAWSVEWLAPDSALEGVLQQEVVVLDGADPEAQDVVEFFLTEGYLDVLGLAPFGKVPVLKSAVDGWKDLSPFFANYSSETLDQIANGFDTMNRWLFRADYGATEKAVIGDIEGTLLIPQVISNIALEGSMTPASGAAWLQGQVEALLAERAE